MKPYHSTIPEMGKQRPVAIFDCDGTLFDIRGILHLLPDRTQPCSPEDYDAFNRACVSTHPHEVVVNVAQALKKLGFLIYIMTGRTDRDGLRQATVAQLIKAEVPFDYLKMRKKGCMLPDAQLKESWLKELPLAHKALVAFEDRDCVVEMFRRNNIMCFQVNKGSY